MLTGFFLKLKTAKVPVSIKEWLTLMEAMHKGVIEPSIDEFYYLARTTLVKDESHYDKFDRAFGEYFKGVEHLHGRRGRHPARVAAEAGGAQPLPGGEGADRVARRVGEADGRSCASASRSRRAGTRAGAR